VQRKKVVEFLMANYRVSVRRACSVSMLHYSAYYYRSTRRSDAPVRQRIKEIAKSRVRYGMWRIYTLLRREGWSDNHKRVHRIYKEEGLSLRSKRPKLNRSAQHRLERPVIGGVNQVWSMDFVADQLFDGRKIRALTLVDNYSRECLAIHVGSSLRSQDVVSVLIRVCKSRNAFPQRIQVDNGSEFISKILDLWAYQTNVTLDFSRPGKPTDNAFIESFNGSFRDECLNVNWFMSLEDAQSKFNHYLEEFNTFRPHSSLNDLTPCEYKNQQTQSPDFSTSE
jgi:putative transposase